jgi:retinol dehydrogenase 12
MSGPSASAVLQLFSQQLFHHPSEPQSDFTGQTVIVTGGNAGLGRVAAKHIARLGATRVILACRTVSKGEEAKEWILEQTKTKGQIEVWQLDMASFASVKGFGQRAASLDRLDAVIENAGIWPGPDKTEFAEGYEYDAMCNRADPLLTDAGQLSQSMSSRRCFWHFCSCRKCRRRQTSIELHLA